MHTISSGAQFDNTLLFTLPLPASFCFSFTLVFLGLKIAIYKIFLWALVSEEPMLINILINLSAPYLPFSFFPRFWGWDSANYISQTPLPVCIQALPIGRLEGNWKLQEKKQEEGISFPPVFDSVATAVAVNSNRVKDPRLQLLLPFPKPASGKQRQQKKLGDSPL